MLSSAASRFETTLTRRNSSINRWLDVFVRHDCARLRALSLVPREA